MSPSLFHQAMVFVFHLRWPGVLELSTEDSNTPQQVVVPCHVGYEHWCRAASRSTRPLRVPCSVTTSGVLQKTGEERDEVGSGSHTTSTPSAGKALMPPWAHTEGSLLPGAERVWTCAFQLQFPHTNRDPTRRKCNPPPPEGKQSPT